MRRGSSLMVAVLLGIVGSASVGASTARQNGAEAPTAGDRYVALGTSIASGFGISVQSTSCGRSSRSYPQLIVAHYGLEFVDVSCGGAVTANVLDTPQGDDPVQISAVTPDAKLITVTVGGNDIGYNATALVCGDPSTDCSPPTTLDADLALSVCSPGGHARQARDRSAIGADRVRDVPARGPAPEELSRVVRDPDAEAVIVRSMGQKLEKMFVDVAKPPGIVFVDPYIAKGDHTACAVGVAAMDGRARRERRLRVSPDRTRP